MTQRKRIGRNPLAEDPLDDLMGPAPASAESPAPAEATKRDRPRSREKARASADQRPPGGESDESDATRERGTERVTFALPADLMGRARDAAYWTPGLALSDLAANGIREQIEALERERGEPFPPRPGRLRPGRRPKD